MAPRAACEIFDEGLFGSSGWVGDVRLVGIVLLVAEELAASRGFEAMNRTEGRWYRFVQDNFDRLSSRIRERPPPAERLVREFTPASEALLDAALSLQEQVLLKL